MTSNPDALYSMRQMPVLKFHEILFPKTGIIQNSCKVDKISRFRGGIFFPPF